ncbi:MAG: glycosyltransferase [Ignavibacteria bacterium]|nr:glycosyltransferase [Ignavibacteria bacterium]
MSKEPLISVLMPVANSKEFISYAIQSILNQSYESFELLIGDSSDDETSEKIGSFRDNRIKHFFLREYKTAEALNFLLEKSSGEFIARMDADDLSDIKRFEVQLNFLSQNKDFDIVGTNFFYISENGKIMFLKRMPEHHKDIEFIMPIYASVLHPTIMCRKVIFDKIGNYNSNYLIEDIEMFLRALEKGFKFYNFQIPLYYYRVRKKSKETVQKQQKEQYYLGYQYISRNDNEKSGANYYFRLGLLEYYNGEMSRARHYFFKYIKNRKKLSLAIIRYIPLTLFGRNLVSFLRKKRVLLRLNFFINKIFKYDLRKINHP